MRIAKAFLVMGIIVAAALLAGCVTDPQYISLPTVLVKNETGGEITVTVKSFEGTFAHQEDSATVSIAGGEQENTGGALKSLSAANEGYAFFTFAIKQDGKDVYKAISRPKESSDSAEYKKYGLAYMKLPLSAGDGGNPVYTELVGGTETRLETYLTATVTQNGGTVSVEWAPAPKAADDQ